MICMGILSTSYGKMHCRDFPIYQMLDNFLRNYLWQNANLLISPEWQTPLLRGIPHDAGCYGSCTPDQKKSCIRPRVLLSWLHAAPLVAVYSVMQCTVQQCTVSCSVKCHAVYSVRCTGAGCWPVTFNDEKCCAAGLGLAPQHAWCLVWGSAFTPALIILLLNISMQS